MCSIVFLLWILVNFITYSMHFTKKITNWKEKKKIVNRKMLKQKSTPICTWLSNNIKMEKLLKIKNNGKRGNFSNIVDIILQTFWKEIIRTTVIYGLTLVTAVRSIWIDIILRANNLNSGNCFTLENAFNCINCMYNNCTILQLVNWSTI